MTNSEMTSTETKDEDEDEDEMDFTPHQEVVFQIRLPEPAAKRAARIFATGLYGATIEAMFQTMVLGVLAETSPVETLQRDSLSERLLGRLEPLLQRYAEAQEEGPAEPSEA